MQHNSLQTDCNVFYNTLLLQQLHTGLRCNCTAFCCIPFSETPRISLLLNARKLETQCIAFQCTSLCFTLHCTMQLQNIALCSAQQFNQCWDLFIALYITLSPAVRLNTHLYPQKDDFVPLVYFFETVDFL